MKKILITICLIFSFFYIADSACAMSLSPVRLELSGYPGDIITDKMTLRNDEKGEITYYSHLENFDASGETGSPKFLPGNSGLSLWIDTAKSVTLAEGEEKTVPFNIRIPEDAKDGGYFSAIFWSVVSPENTGSQVLIGSKVGTLILLRVGDPIISGNGLKEFGTIDNQKFFTSIPVSLYYRFENGGSDRLKPLGSIVIRNMFNKEVITINANQNDGNVLPGSVRRFDMVWEDKEAVRQPGFFGELSWQWSHFNLGLYSANLTLNYGGDDLAIQTFDFFILPWQLILCVLVLLAVLIIIMKLYNKWIISKAKKYQS